jgi:hypothetical protein
MDAFVFIPAKHAFKKLKATLQLTIILLRRCVQYNKSLDHLSFRVLHFSQLSIFYFYLEIQTIPFLSTRFPTRSPYFTCFLLYSAKRIRKIFKYGGSPDL